jgi:hypothetical protein
MKNVTIASIFWAIAMIVVVFSYNSYVVNQKTIIAKTTTELKQTVKSLDELKLSYENQEQKYKSILKDTDSLIQDYKEQIKDLKESSEDETEEKEVKVETTKERKIIPKVSKQKIQRALVNAQKYLNKLESNKNNKVETQNYYVQLRIDAQRVASSIKQIVDTMNLEQKSLDSLTKMINDRRKQNDSFGKGFKSAFKTRNGSLVNDGLLRQQADKVKIIKEWKVKLDVQTKKYAELNNVWITSYRTEHRRLSNIINKCEKYMEAVK